MFLLGLCSCFSHHCIYFLLTTLEGHTPKTNFPFDFPNPGNPASSLMFPQIGSAGFYGSANMPQAFSPYLLPSQNSWANAALNNPQAFANILTPNHPALQVHPVQYVFLFLMILKVLTSIVMLLCISISIFALFQVANFLLNFFT